MSKLRYAPIVVFLIIGISLVAMSCVADSAITRGVVTAVGVSSSDREDQSQTSDRYQALLDRACAIYQDNTGAAIDSEQLRDALDQARSELQEEALEVRLQNLVEDGKLTQEEADNYLEWWQSRPDIAVPLPGLGGAGPGDGMMG